jgi:hypothetical protein
MNGPPGPQGPQLPFPTFGRDVNSVPPATSGRDAGFERISDDVSERLSDIPSDLESPPPSEIGSDNGKKTIEIPKTPRKPRGRAAKAKPRIIEI